MASSTREDEFAQALYTSLEPAVAACDASIQGALESQVVLSSQMERLRQELERLANASELPSIVPYIGKLGSSRRRLVEINAKIARIEKRLEGIRSLVRRKLSLGSPAAAAGAPSSASSEATAGPAGSAAPQTEQKRRILSISEMLEWQNYRPGTRSGIGR